MKILRVLITFGAIMIVGIVFLVGGIVNKINLSKPRVDLAELEADEIKSGMIVEGTILELWDEFAYEEGDGVNYSYYAMPLESSFGEDEPVFIALGVSSPADKSTASKMSGETDDYYIYDIVPDKWTELTITGKVSKISGEALDYFEEYIDYMDYDTDRNMQPYVIKRFNPGSENVGLIIGGIMTAVGAIPIVLMLVFAIAKRKQ